MNSWRIATTSAISRGAFSSRMISQNTLKQSLRRLRRSEGLYSVLIGKVFVHFDPSLVRRWRYVESLPLNAREAYASRAGIVHHLKIQTLSLSLQEVNPSLVLRPNVLSEYFSSSIGSDHPSRGKYAPDLIISHHFSGLERSLLYLEVERTLKAEKRYFDRWSVYEADPVVKLCLYIMDDEALMIRLIRMMEDFFRRKAIFDDFQLGILSEAVFDKFKLDASVQLFSLAGSRKARLGEIFPAEQSVPLNVPEAYTSDFKMSPNGEVGEWSAALLADSPPPPILGVLTVREGSQLIKPESPNSCFSFDCRTKIGGDIK